MILMDFNQSVIASVVVATNNLDKESARSIDISNVKHIFYRSLMNIAQYNSSNYGSIVICCDSHKVWRKDVFPYYKYNRKKSREEGTTGINWQVVFDAIPEIEKDIREYFPYKVIRVDGAEADDIIAILSKKFSTKTKEVSSCNIMEELLGPEIEKTLIYSSDGDFKQLQVYKNVDQYSALLKKKIVEKDPIQFLKEKIIRGDGGDGIPNILSDDDSFVMKKRQKSIMSKKLELWMTQEEPDFLLDSIVKERYLMNKKLIDLVHEIPKELEDKILEEYESTVTGKKSHLINFLIKNRLSNLMDKIQYIV